MDQAMKGLRERLEAWIAEDRHGVVRPPFPIYLDDARDLSAALARVEALEGRALAYDETSRRLDDAHSYAQKHTGPRDLGRNVWHVVLDDALRLRAALSDADGAGESEES